MRKLSVGELKLPLKSKQLVQQVLKSNRLSYGAISQQFESEFARMHQSKYAVFCNSGTDALQIALQALKEIHQWKDGDEVVVPAVTFVATANIVLHNNMKPVFVDVNNETYNIDVRKIEGVITKRTKAIIPVHLMGLPCEMETIWKLSKKYNLKIIEDSCESMLATYKGKSVGSLGDIGCFSTYVAHLLVTGVGGLSTTNDAHLATKMRSLMNHGRDHAYLNIDDDDVARGKKLFSIVQRRFRFNSIGHSSRCTELEAALGLGQLPVLEKIVTKRQKNAQKLIRLLSDLQEFLQLPSIPADTTHSFMLFPLVLKKGSRNELIQYLEEHGIETRYLMPLINQPIYRELYGEIEDEFPVSKWLNHQGFYIGCHQYLTKTDLDYISQCFHDYFR